MRKALLLIVAACLFGASAASVTLLTSERTPGEIIRYAERRLIGHPKLEAAFLPLLERWRTTVERPVRSPLPSLGKGQQSAALPPQTFAPDGTPVPVRLGHGFDVPREPHGLVTDITELERALEAARPGQTIEIAPGTYRMERSLRLRNGGTSDAPIFLRARTPGSVTILSTASEGFHVLAPFWVFENLTLRGVCSEHANCEHAFHVVGKARSVVIRNNRIENFNAQIKVNGDNGQWPDHGLVQFNTLNNSRVRETANPVTTIDIVGASSWVVGDNDVRNFVKHEGNRISYGIFMKGGGKNGSIVRNLVVCTEREISRPGSRVGISFGGGGTVPAQCRDGRCITEHSEGTIGNNIIAHCNDFGVYLNNSARTTVKGNSLVNTYGIDSRFPLTRVDVIGNFVDGVIRSRDGASLSLQENVRPLAWQLFVPAFDHGFEWASIVPGQFGN